MSSRFTNRGSRTGFLHLDLASADSRLQLAGKPATTSVVLAPQESHVFSLQFTAKAADTGLAVAAPNQVELALDVYTGDELTRRRRRQCRRRRREADEQDELQPQDSFDGIFLNEEFFSEPRISGALHDHACPAPMTAPCTAWGSARAER